MRFHSRIAAISGNPIFEAVSEAMLGWLREYHTEMLIWTGKQNVTLAEHREILDHIRRHDPDAAETAMIRHLDRSAVLYAHHG
jgi:DNA-binding FadR family transcriptional regulator